MNTLPDEAEAIVLVRSGSEVRKQGEATYCAGILPNGNWVRLSPLSFRDSAEAAQLKRWDRVRFRWRAAENDSRVESCTVQPHTMAIVGGLTQDERSDVVLPLETNSLKYAVQQGKTLVLVRPKEPKFMTQRKTQAQLDAEHRDGAKNFPYRFSYKFSTDDGEYEAAYHDAEMNVTLANLSKSFGEAQTVSRILHVYGKEMPRKGMLFVMTRSAQPNDTWQICGILGLDEVESADLRNLNLVV